MLANLNPIERKIVRDNRAERRRRAIQERYRDWAAIEVDDPNDFDIPSNAQGDFLRSEADERWIFGGNRASKTESAVYDCLMFVQLIHPVRNVLQNRRGPVAVRYCAPKWRDGILGVIHKKFKEMCPREWLRGNSWRKAYSVQEAKLYFKTGSTIAFKSGEQDLDTYGGDDLDAVYQDEHMALPYYKENRARLTDRNGYLVSTMTPEKGITWEEDHVTEPPDGLTIDHWFFDQRGNPHLDPDGVRKFIASIKDEDSLEIKVKGRFVAKGGLVLPQWDPRIHMVPDYVLPLEWPRVIIGDFHTRTASAVLWGCWKPDGTLVIYRAMKEFFSIPEWKRAIRGASAGEKIAHFGSDEPGSGTAKGKDIHGQETICRQFNKDTDGAGKIPFVQVNKSSGSFNARIYRLWDMLAVDGMTEKSQIEVFKSCDHSTRTVNGKPLYAIKGEMKRYQFKKESAADEEQLREQVRGVHCHYIDDLGYMVMIGPPRVGGQTKVQSGLEEVW